MATTVSALTIVEMPQRLHNILSDRGVVTLIRLLRRFGPLTAATFLDALPDAGLSADANEVLISTEPQELERAIREMADEGEDHTDIREVEFSRLVRAAHEGAPAVPSSVPGGVPTFEVRVDDVQHFPGPTQQRTLRVTPVSRLRMVIVQKGYQRLDPATGAQMSVGFHRDAHDWFPGIELYGEGIFIDMVDVLQIANGPRATSWLKRYRDSGQTSDHPVHVWWHTLAHRILRGLSVDSGYSAASIRERVYLSSTTDEHPSGGVLLYTVQPGGDGTLGGLMALVPSFDTVLRSALIDIETCSNDPLCEETATVGGDGAACYSCLLTSETSCEHRNGGLDRLLLIEARP